ncbi:DUF6266 family protein [Proteiniphilum saccharofermentans]|uniref:DUF6266 family protein n=1 Tax=Proteiniphilum saccharofermentans TaxID=1642647 RepID=UPI0028AAB74E|nr:DUF6266 family protein [Proteiniphilum saccharofermentans]
MGTIDFSKLFGISGKIGPLVAYVTKDGKQVFRSYTKPRNPKTPKQTEQRARFALVNKGLSPLHKIIKQGHPGDENVYRKLVGKACREAVVGTYPDLRLDYSQIQIAVGRLQLPADINLHFESLSHTATFSWNTQLVYPSQAGSDNDRMNIVCFDSAHPAEMKTFYQYTRATGKAVISLDGDWQPSTTHFWIFLTSYDMRDISNSVYIQPDNR